MRWTPQRVFVVVLLAGTAVMLASLVPHTPAPGPHTLAATRAVQVPARLSYGAFLLLLMGVVPALVYGAFWWLPACLPRLLTLPHAAHWLAPEQAPATRAFLRDHGCRLGSLMVVELTGTHLLLLNGPGQPSPATLAGLALLVFLFSTGLALWLMHFYRRFRLTA